MVTVASDWPVGETIDRCPVSVDVDREDDLTCADNLSETRASRWGGRRQVAVVLDRRFVSVDLARRLLGVFRAKPRAGSSWRDARIPTAGAGTLRRRRDLLEASRDRHIKQGLIGPGGAHPLEVDLDRPIV